jgi:hypothetical protein
MPRRLNHPNLPEPERMDHPHPSLLYKIPPSHLRGPTYWLGSSLFSYKPLSVAEDGRAEAEELGLVVEDEGGRDLDRQKSFRTSSTLENAL